ncbi:MAG: hypothetical protein IJ060_04280 [Oscillospiraceae bacterium]|nr:hypothetical protein [Oscillospiraceae bacterium]
MKTTKLLAILGAAMLSCCALGGAAFAEETEPVDYSQYQLGDITMDGVVDVEDVHLMADAYTYCLAWKNPVEYGIVTEQQIKLGNIDRQSFIETNKHGDTIEFPIDLSEALCVLMYYTDSLAQKLNGKTLEEYAVDYLHLNEQ